MKSCKALPLLALAALGPAGCGEPTAPVARVEVSPGEVRLPFSQARTVHLAWAPAAAAGNGTPTVFVHLLDARKKVVRTFDHPFPEPWREGTPVGYDLKLFQSALAPPLSPGRYQVVLGLYGKDGKRWPLEGLGQAVGRDEYAALAVEVPNSDPRPRFAFAPGWMEPEPGSDRQVLARRWLVDRGAIRLVDQHEAGTVWMVVRIPPSDLPGYRMALREGAAMPSVTIRGNCGAPETSLTGPGLHEVEVGLDPPPAGEFCELTLAASFTLEPQGPTGRKRSVSLDNLAWLPGSAPQAQPTDTEP